MSVPTRNRFSCFSVVVLALLPSPLYSQPAGFCCREPQPPHFLTMCSPLANSLRTNVVAEGLQITFDAPPISEATYVSAVVSPDSAQWGVEEGQPVPGITLSGEYRGVEDQRIELAVTQINTGSNADADSGFVGVDVVTVVWSSVFRSAEEIAGTYILDASTVNRPLRFIVPAMDSIKAVPGLRVTFQSGTYVRKGWTAVFDVEDFEGFHIWRWASDPNQEPRVVGTYSKLERFRTTLPQDTLNAGKRPRDAWPGATFNRKRFTFLDRFVIDGNVYHYAVTTYDQGFDRIRGGALEGLGVPFDSPLPVDGCDSQLRVDFLRPPPQEFQSVQAVPNPYREVNCRGEDPLSTCTVRFIRMPSRGQLLIFTLAGDLVREFNHPDDAQAGDPPGTLRWDTNNQSTEPVASGVYIFKIIDLVSGQQSYGRLAIIR